MSLTKVVLVSGYNLLVAGCSGPVVCALSRKYGKRPVFIASTLFDIIGTAIGEAKISYKYLLAARVVQGFSTSAFESLIVAAVGDMYFVHQRGLRIAVINFILNAASSLASIICGQVFEKLGWLWLFHMFQIFLVAQFVLMFLFCPETTYNRDSRYETDIVQDEKLGKLAAHEEKVRVHGNDTELAQTTIWAGHPTEEDICPGARSLDRREVLTRQCLEVSNRPVAYLAQPCGLLRRHLLWTSQQLVCRIRHHPLGNFCRTPVDVQCITDRIPGCRSFHRWHDRLHFRRCSL